MHIAMWSGPRNLSTAMMYAFGARNDCAVWDEPFYGPYLAHTQKPHPMLDEIFANEECDPHVVAQRCTGTIPNTKKIFYQKHMPHHMEAGFPLGWIEQVSNVFLIRHPARVIASYIKKNGHPTLADIGVESQLHLFKNIYQRTGQPPIVIDSDDIRANPEKMLKQLCTAIGIKWDSAMLSWPKGGHSSDGTWAPHWYKEVWNSTGFAPPEGVLPTLPQSLEPLLRRAKAHYEYLNQFKITA